MDNGEVNSCLQCFHHSTCFGRHQCTSGPEAIDIKQEYGDVDLDVWNCENWESSDDDLYEE